MKRIILMVFRSLLNLPFWLIRIFQLCNIDKYDVHTRYAFLHRIIPIVIRRGRIKIHVTGLENLPKENGYVMFPNHQGLFDALAIIQTHERPLVTVMKKEVKNIFLLKQVITMLQAEIIDREDIRQSMQVIMNMTRRLKTGENFILFAEGTRSKKGNSLLEFKGGSFKSAMNAKCPIVPVALIDSYKAFDTGSIKKLTVQVHYLKPLYYADYKGMKSTELADLVSEMIREKIKFETMT
ncbi:MAG: 1-acyl-sn-glycerol-3-phosphate acyltransferase [Clostridiales bacterium]|jgi:1-acyl-sn-glycerol-3-phosphate acyltransferase|nr:1-acyl-sn-glycerol-3-phosphate acyltransferase [Clostridiales bacterium]